MIQQPNSAGVSSSLGILTKSIHREKALKRKTEGRAGVEYRQIRYDLQRHAQGLLWDRDAMKQHRVVSCSRNVASDGVNVYRTTDGKDARFANVIMCGSGWACPVCAAKITEGRRIEIQQAVNAWVKMGGSVLLMTLTFSHSWGQGLAELMPRFAQALTKFKNSKTYKAMKEKHGIRYTFKDKEKAGASIRGLEVTHGENGWHPHTHDLLFVNSDGLLNDGPMIDALKAEWVKQLIKFGLGESSKLNDLLDHAFQIQGGDYAAEYIAKFGHEPKLYHGWSAAQEVAKSNVKLGGGLHATPFQLLQWSLNGDRQAGQLFREYVKEFDGKRMLFWSVGLKHVLLDNDIEATDEELANDDEQKPEEELIYRLSTDDWRLVLTRNARGEMLHVAAFMGAEGIESLLRDLSTRPATHSGYFVDFARRNFQ